jgi:tetratricopeptide (TPR) repeat protein
VPASQREPGSTLPQNSVLVAYHRGSVNQQAGGSGASDFAAASAMPLTYVSPNRPSSLPALRLAIQNNSSDATAHYLLGMLYMSQRNVDDAIAEWQIARAIRKDLPTLHRNLGRALLDLKNDPVSALPVLTEGLTYDPSNPDLQNAYQRALAAAPAALNCSFTVSGSTALGAAGLSQFEARASPSAESSPWSPEQHSSAPARSLAEHLNCLPWVELWP